MKLLDALRRTCDLLESSADSDWTVMSAEEIRKELLEFISALESKEQYDKSRLSLLFGPTGPVQETSMANDWSDEMLDLAHVIDMKN